MPRYIDAEKMAADESEAYMRVQASELLANLMNHVVHEKIQMLIAQTPTVDAAPVVHGTWEKRKDVVGFVCCSVCHDCNIYDEWPDGKKWRYCPNCGAKMDGGGENV